MYSKITGNRPDLLSVLVDELKEGDLYEEVLEIFTAGHITTASALTWACYFMTQEPQVMEKMYLEIDNVLGGRLPTFNDISKLTYMEMIIQESLRMYPPAHLVLRTTHENDLIDGFQIQANMAITPQVYVIHHHPEIWNNPNKFDPDRFLPERLSERHNFAWSPFGAGQRICIGKDFAMIEAKIALVRIAQRYRFSLHPECSVKPKMNTAIEIEGKVLVKLKKV